MNLDSIRLTFFAECDDQLAELENGLLTIAGDGADAETVNAVFRAVHSIKGGAGAFSLDALVSYAHKFENALDKLRNDLTIATPDRIALLQRAADTLTDVVAAARDETAGVDVGEVTKELDSLFDLSAAAEEEEDVAFTPVPISIDMMGSGDNAEAPKPRFTVRFRPGPELYRNGHDPQRLFRDLREIAECTVTPDVDAVPSLDRLDGSACFLSWTIEVAGDCTESDIRRVFEWVEDACELSVEADGETGDEGPSLDDLLAGFADEPAEPLTEEREDSAEEPAVPVIAMPQSAVGTAAPAQAPQPAAKKESAAAMKTMRVDSEKVDKLINLMGELVINQSMLAQQISDIAQGSATPASIALAELGNLTREIQSSVMAIRAQPIKPIFMRMQRVVREVCQLTGKKVVLELDGEGTEVDTTVVEGLTDPLTHMIRNAADHGVETAEERLRNGKPESGTIRLSAAHNSGRIVIEIRDDGQGINRERVLQKAIERGIVAADAKLADEEIDELIFAPGFSTAETITDVSGRGVGMDVVRRSIQELGGRVSIQSTPGQGSCFTLSLPLTLAILDGMLVRSADQVLVLPISSVIEAVKVKEGDIFQVGRGQHCIRLRGNIVPVVDVASELGFSAGSESFANSTVVFVESAKGTMSALLVDAIEGQQQVVIKSMESNYGRIPCIAAATILGNGKIALILDIEDIFYRKGKSGTVLPEASLVA